MVTQAFTGITHDQDLDAWSANWTNVNSDAVAVGSLAGDSLEAAATTGQQLAAQYSGASFNTNQYASAQCSKTSDSALSIAPAVRVQSGTVHTCYSLYFSALATGNITGQIIKVKDGASGAGSPTQYELLATTFSFPSGDYIRIEAEGDATSTEIRVYTSTDGATWGTAIKTHTDTSTPITGGNAGLMSAGFSDVNLLDNWEGGDLGAAASTAKNLLLLGVG